MSQPSRANNLLAFPGPRQNSKFSKLNTVRCRMLPAQPSVNSEKWPRISVKARHLAEQQPEAAALIEELIDDVLSEAR